MRQLLMIGVLAGLSGVESHGQAMMDATAAVTGGTAGVVAGKKVSEAVNPVFGKMAKQLDKAAGDAAPKSKAALPASSSAPAHGTAPMPGTGTAPMIDIGPGVPKRAPSTRAAVPISGGVPLPPPPAVVPARTQVLAKPVRVEPILLSAPPAPPPPPVVTADDLKQLAEGMDREDVLKLGAPASRITMFEDGHLIESYRYATRETAFGHVKLTDGKVSSIDVR